MPAPRLTPELRIELLAAVKAIVFDKDGTLTELNARWVVFFQSIIATIAADGDDPGAERSLSECLGVEAGHIVPGSPAAVKTESELMTIALDHLVERGWSPEQALVSMGAGVESATFGPLAPLGDVRSAVAKLAGSFRLAVATSDNRDNTIDELNQLGVAEHISLLRCGNDGGAVKPEAEVLLSIARDWGLQPHELLFVGDSEQDRDTAVAAGTRFVAVAAEAPPSDSHDHSRADSLDHLSPATVGADAWIATIDELIV